MSGRKVVKRACDGCKIRKIRCNEVAPCEGCVAAGISCTFVKHPAVRGPRKLRKSTLDEIAQTQKQWERLNVPQPSEPVVHTRLDSESVFAPAKIASLVLQLCVYRLRVYPIWPIIKVERLVASLQKPQPDIEVFSLAYAVAAATIIRINTDQMSHSSGVTAEQMLDQCLFAKDRRNKDQAPDLTTVRIPFFLHIYYDTIEPGGLKSITYLREAIAVAHMIGLHRESYYGNVQPEEQEIRRRTLWLLFVTERSVSIKHKLPVTIKTTIKFPSTIDTDEKNVLEAYQKLISMFWSFDQSGVFELLDNQDFDLSKSKPFQEDESEALTSVRKRLDESSLATTEVNGLQSLEIAVSRLWMLCILWRLAESHGFFSQSQHKSGESSRDPIALAVELLEILNRADKNAIEAAALDTKIFEIASTVADAYFALSDSGQSNQALRETACSVLMQLQLYLTRTPSLVKMLQSKLSQIRPDNFGFPSDDMLSMSGGTTYMDPEIERQLQAHGFDFTEPMMPDQSPGTDSLTGALQLSPSTDGHGGQARRIAGFSQSLSPMSDQFYNQGLQAGWNPSQNDGNPATISPYNQMMPGMNYDFNALNPHRPSPTRTADS